MNLHYKRFHTLLADEWRVYDGEVDFDVPLTALFQHAADCAAVYGTGPCRCTEDGSLVAVCATEELARKLCTR